MEYAQTAMNYVAPRWLPGGNLQTIWPALYSRRVFGLGLDYRRERWPTPDGDFVDVDWLEDVVPPLATDAAERPLLVLFHGLEGSSRSHYAEAFADFSRERGFAYAVPHFRGCSGELNHAPRAYHSGDYEEIGWILAQFRVQHRGPIMAVGVSLGGNALLRWAQEMGDSAAQVASGVAAVCSPIDLAAGGYAIGRGFNRLVYTRMFLNTMVPKALRKLEQHPGLFDGQALKAARDLYEFDNVFTAPLHGFKSTEDYWGRASAKPHLHRIRIPALVVNARNDPFVPAWCLPSQADVGQHVTLWQPAHGGHVGFPQGPIPGHVRTMPDAVGGWLAQRLG
jgi:predicted alpha/beta-fold hydrolase